MRVYQRVIFIIVLLLLLAGSFIGLIFVVKNCSGRPIEPAPRIDNPTPIIDPSPLIMTEIII